MARAANGLPRLRETADVDAAAHTDAGGYGRSWMASTEHRPNILDPSFTDTGLGVVAALPASLGIGRTGDLHAVLRRQGLALRAGER